MNGRKPTIFRDDDISVSTDLSILKPIHNKFKEANVMHTVAIIAKDLELNKELVTYLRKENFDIQLHCWEHYNFTEQPIEKLKEDIKAALSTLLHCGFDRPKVIYPPWNCTNKAVNVMIWDTFGIDVSIEKCSLSYYVKHNGEVPYNVVNFHYWDSECDDLDEALRIYNLKR